MKKRIVFTGGGTAGHVTPNLALIAAFQQLGWKIDYIGSRNGIEERMIIAVGVPFHAITCGKLRRYLTLKNLFEPFRILWGIIQSLYILKRLKPNVVFSKGGFVAFPVVVAAWVWRVPILAHESDLSPGLANRLSLPFINKMCLTFAPSKLPDKRFAVTGTPIREALFTGSREKGLGLCGFQADKPCLLVIGGGQGAGILNDVIREGLTEITKKYQVIHLCGRDKEDANLRSRSGYYQLGYADEELPDLLAAADVVLSRAGANSLYELLALNKLHILVPLSPKVSRGDQVENANFFEKKGISVVIDNDALTVDALMQAIEEVNARKEEILTKMAALNIRSATQQIGALIQDSAI